MVVFTILEITTSVLLVGLMLPATIAMWRWAFWGKSAGQGKKK